MSDVTGALAQLRAARQAETATTSPAGQERGGGEETVTAPASPAAPPAGPARGEIKTLAGRVPLSLHRELTRALLDAADELRVGRVNVDEGLEAAIRAVLHDDAARERWYGELREVRRERREG